MPGFGSVRPTGSWFALLLLGCAAPLLVSCESVIGGSQAGLLQGSWAEHRVTPTAFEVGGATDPEAWALFDRDVAVGWAPPLADGTAAIELFLDGPQTLSALKVHGPSGYRLSVEPDDGGSVEVDLSTLPEGWSEVDLAGASAQASVTLRFTAIAGAAAGEVSELELWAVGELLPMSTLPAADSATALPPHFDALPASGTPAKLAPDGSLSPSCASLTVSLDREPSVYRRAWLRLRAVGVFRPFVLSRALNGASMIAGHWVPDDDKTPRAFVYPIDPEALNAGPNELHFCLPAEATASVELSAAELLLELDHGSNAVASMAIAPVDGVPTSSAAALLAESGSVTLGGAEELVVGFDRLLALDRLYVEGVAEGLSARCIDAQGSATQSIALSSLGATATGTLYGVEAPVKGCAGVRLGSGGGAQLDRLRIFGSGAARRIDFPQIVLASAREHFGYEAWVDGWARAPSKIAGGVRVYLDAVDVGTSSGLYGQRIVRSTDPTLSWPVEVSATFGDGSKFAKRFLLEGAGKGWPGSQGLLSAYDDGLTREERGARYGRAGQVIEEIASPEAATHVALGTHVSVDVPPGAVHVPTQFTVKHLFARDLPPLDPGLINVTAPAAEGYEFQPHGATFGKALTIGLPYQANLIPQGYLPDDVQTYFYDEKAEQWERLPRTELEREGGIVRSETDHFTVMINAVAVAPEHPGVANFDPNRIKGIEAAHPGAGIALIAPPSPNPNGDATLSYPFVVPPGRLGLQPELSLSYSSGRGNGWVGVGWDVGVSSIEIDTRWGAPHFDATYETETYALDGQQLSPAGHLAKIERNSGDETERVFYPRVEGAFRKIIRHGVTPATYWWEVIDKAGTRYLYGAETHTDGQPIAHRDSVLRSRPASVGQKGSITRWALREVRDLFGNHIVFEYQWGIWDPDGDAEEDAAGNRLPNVEPGHDLYLSKIYYTLDAAETNPANAPYQVSFLRESRDDILVNARGGFKHVTAERLRRVEVSYHPNGADSGQPIRAWTLGYTAGPFGKSLLQTLTQLGPNDELFAGNVHSFTYYDDTDGGDLTFQAASSWAADADSFDMGNGTPNTGAVLVDLVKTLGGEVESGLGGTVTHSVGGHLYVGIGPAGEGKSNTIGLKVGGHYAKSDTYAALVDIDGDGLPDRVYRAGEASGQPKYVYHRNRFTPGGMMGFEAEPTEIGSLGAPWLGADESSSFAFGIEAYPGGASLIANLSHDWSRSETYMSDVNNDGYVDMVHGGQVYFNKLDASGRRTFEAGSGGTAVILPSGEAIDPSIVEGLQDIKAQQKEQSPLIDTVRAFVAPGSGKVRITGDVELLPPDDPEATDLGDGVAISIELNGEIVYPQQVDAPNTDADDGPETVALAPGSTPVEIDTFVQLSEGNVLLFRVHGVDDARFDRVRWAPHIQYVDADDTARTPALDDNGLDFYRYDAEEEFTLAGRPGMSVNVPAEGQMRFTASMQKEATSDALQLQLIVDGTIVWSRDYDTAASSLEELDVPFAVNRTSAVQLRGYSDTPIDLTAIHLLHPTIEYVSAVDEQGNDIETQLPNGKPALEFPLGYDLSIYDLRSPQAPATTYIPPETRTATVTATVTGVTGTVTFAAKTADGLLAKETATIEESGAIAIDVDMTADEPIFFSATSPGGTLFSVTANYPDPDDEPEGDEQQATIPVPVTRYTPSGGQILARPYRGWSHFAFRPYEDPDNDIALTSPIDLNELYNNSPAWASAAGNADNVDRDSFEQEGEDNVKDPATGPRFFPLYPVPDALPCDEDYGQRCPAPNAPHWRGPDAQVFLTATELSASRLGEDLPAVEMAAVAAPPRIGLGYNQGGALGFVATLGVSSAQTYSDLDYRDLNGDGFPDIVSKSGVQYTSPRGALLATASGVGEIQSGESTQASLGIGGTVPVSEGKTSGGAEGVKSQEPSVGFGVNAGMTVGVSQPAATLMDVNGDGLPDLLRRAGPGQFVVQLNYGYAFGEAEPWGGTSSSSALAIDTSYSQQLSLGWGLGFNDGIYGWGFGLDVSMGRSRLRNLTFLASSSEESEDDVELFEAEIPFLPAAATMLDVNGDGLLDAVVPVSDRTYDVYYGTGAGLSDTKHTWQLPYTDVEIAEAGQALTVAGESIEEETDLAETRTTSVSANLYFTISIPIVAVKLVINPGLNGGAAIGRPISRMQDLDGDGLLDHLMSGHSGELWAARNPVGKTNLLATVTRPMGAEIELDYERAGNTQHMPQSRWVLSHIEVYDGNDKDGANAGADLPETDRSLTRVHYADGGYDRAEREFLGFGTMVVEQMNTAGWDGNDDGGALPVYRRTITTTNVEDYYLRGLPTDEVLQDGAGALYSHTQRLYEKLPVLDSSSSPVAESFFPALRTIESAAYEGGGPPLRTTESLAYDRYGNVIREDNEGQADDSTDDYVAHVTYSWTDPACEAKHLVGAATSLRVTDPSGTQVLRHRQTTIDCTDGTLDAVTTHYDDTASASSSGTTTLTYLANGNLESVTGPENDAQKSYEVWFTYDPEVDTHIATVTDSHDYTSSSTYDVRFGLPTSETDQNGQTVSMGYDDFGRLIWVQSPYEQAADVKTIAFDYAPEATEPWAHTSHYDVGHPGDPIETYTYVDGLGRVLQTKKDASVHQGAGLPAAKVLVVSGRMHWDAYGRVVAAWHPTTNALGSTAIDYGRDGTAPTRSEYDVLDRVRTITLPDDTTTTTDYAIVGSDSTARAQTHVQDAEGRQRTSLADARGRIREVIEHARDVEDGMPVEDTWRQISTRYEYDPIGQILAVVDAKGNTTSVVYDQAGRRTQVTHPDSGTASTVYDAAGNITATQTANLAAKGLQIEYDYDINLLKGVRYPEHPELNVTYDWGDATLRGKGGNLVGRITRVTDGSGVEERSYGPLGEVVEQTRIVYGRTPLGNDDVYHTSYLYDAFNRLRQVSYPDGETLSYQYDSGGLVQSASGTKAGLEYPYVQRLEYDRFGQRAFVQQGNGVQTTYAYQSTTRRLEDLKAASFQSVHYAYDATGNITQLTNSPSANAPSDYAGDTTHTYRYDDLNRLVQATGHWERERGPSFAYAYDMAYDDLHNITHKTQTQMRLGKGGAEVIDRRGSFDWEYAYAGSKPHAPSSVGGRRFDYDPNGNLIRAESEQGGRIRRIAWDEENRPLYVADGGRKTEFVYDAGGERVLKRGAQGETIYVNPLWTVRNRAIGTKHIWVGTSRIASKLTPGRANLDPAETDQLALTLGTWQEAQAAGDIKVSTPKTNLGDRRVPSAMPEGGLPESHFAYFYHPDHLGSTSYVTDRAGELYEHVQYVPSGEVWVEQARNNPNLPYLFTSKRIDSETGLYDFGARMYDPRVGLWASTDPAMGEYLGGEGGVTAGGLGGHFNPAHLQAYCYAVNNPIGAKDPNGRNDCDVNDPGCVIDPAPVEEGLKVLAWVAEQAADVAIRILSKGRRGIRPPRPRGRQTSGRSEQRANAEKQAEANSKGAQRKSAQQAQPSTSEQPSRAPGGGGRGANRLKPDSTAQGPHSTFKRDPQTGKVTGHAEWKPNPRNPSGFDEAKRVDVTGEPHFNKATKQDVPTPHTHGKDIPGGVRPATPDEVPQ